MAENPNIQTEGPQVEPVEPASASYDEIIHVENRDIGIRKTMKFLVPVSDDALGSLTTSGRNVVPFYINPSSVVMNERKLVNKQLTKGGYVIQYFGEELPSMQVNGTTGSGGIEAINVLRDVYRNEQIQITKQMLNRMQATSDDVVESLEDLNSLDQAKAVGSNLLDAFDSVTNGGASNWIEGGRSIIQGISDAFNGTQSDVTNRQILYPSTGAYFVSMDIYFQGEKLRGFFTNFTVTERGDSPGLFDYSFTFEVTKRIGTRKNFMPWHRNPRDVTGAPRSAATPMEKQIGLDDDGLSYPVSTTTRDAQVFVNPDLITQGPFAGESASVVEDAGISLDRNGSLSDT